MERLRPSVRWFTRTHRPVPPSAPTTAQVAFAGLAPGFVGLVQVNIVVPSDLQTGNYPLTVTIGSETSNSATISITQ